MTEPARGLFNWKILFLVWGVLLLVQFGVQKCTEAERVPYSAFKQQVAADNVDTVVMSKQIIRGKYREPVDGKREFATVRVDDPELVGVLEQNGVTLSGVEEAEGCGAASWLLPVVLVLLVLSLVRARLPGGGAGAFSFGRSRAKLYAEKDVGVTFEDVAGVDEAKAELAEVVELLRDPKKFGRLGGRLPKGILLVGPPGTGKTLLARAVAGEAGVPFFSINGSEFVELFVGVGAARVRDLFNDAAAKAPCIVFIDELDALGKARGLGPMSHDEREQTLNQLLVELDGFDPHSGVVLMAATNRPEILDPALLRAGRFDRHVLVDRPDKAGRLAILKVHTRTVTLADDADLDAIAAMTPGFAGADLANIVNAAALLAVRANKDAVGNDELHEAVERVIAGLEKRSRVLTPSEKERVAYHEIGHALVAIALPGATRVQKISVIPRGISALGYTLQLPTEDRFLMTETELRNKIAGLLGGRIAEQIVFDEVSTGAQDDLRKATDVATAMVQEYGMSDRVGNVSLARERTSPFLADERLAGERAAASDQTSREVDMEVRRIIDEQYRRARVVLERQEPALRAAAAALLERETLSGDELEDIVAQTLSAVPRGPTTSAHA